MVGLYGNHFIATLLSYARTGTSGHKRTAWFNQSPALKLETTAKALIRRTVIDPPSNRPRTALVYEHFSCKADCIATFNRADDVLLARLRPGHKLLHLLDPTADPSCRLCKEEPQTLEHWLQRRPNLDVLLW